MLKVSDYMYNTQNPISNTSKALTKRSKRAVAEGCCGSGLTSPNGLNKCLATLQQNVIKLDLY